MSAKPVFTINQLSVAYDRKLVLRDVNLSINPSSLVAIVGPNGAGKSTLIKAALGLTPKLSGKIEAFGEPFKKAGSRIGYVPQRESVDWDFPISVYDVVLMGTYGRIGWFKKPNEKHHAQAIQALIEVGMLEFKDRQISQLSGGQQQRTFLARALAQQADLYFMDEPFAGVDAATEDAIFQVLKKLKQEGKSVIAVHHNLNTVNQYFDEVIFIKKELIAAGPTHSVFNEKNLAITYDGLMNATFKSGLLAGAIM
jgi:manganese/zinc/iron transport system ATP- binding protein